MKIKHRILYLEKDRHLAKAVKKKLVWSGYLVETSDDEIECLQKIRTRAVDLLIIDYSTPQINALNMLENMRMRGVVTLSILVISKADTKIINEAVKHGCVDHVVKDQVRSNYIEQLQSRIFQVLDRQRTIILNTIVEKIRPVQQHQPLNTQSQLANAFFETTSDAVFITDEKLRITFINPTFSTVTGYSSKQIIGQNISLLNENLYNQTTSKHINKTLEQENFWQGELLIRHRAGNVIPVWQSISVKKDATTGRIIKTISLFRDISQQKKAEATIKFQANYDELTQLPNRSLFLDRLSNALKHAQRNNNCVALMLIDLDKFKWVNDNMGHHVGDILLQNTAKKLASSVRKSDTVARLGGDEFIVILPELEKGGEAEIIAEKIFQSFSSPVAIDDHELYITCSIGIAIYPTDGIDTGTLQKNADKAMYTAKTCGLSNSYRFYTKSMQEQTEKRLSLISKMHRGIENCEFTINYQPIFDVSTNTVCSAEALLRWNHPLSGLIPAEQFIPLAEESGLIRPLGNWVITRVAEDMNRWLSSGLKPINISINKSAAQFAKKGCDAEWLDILKSFQIQPENITIEITENIFINQTDGYSESLANLQAQGIKISLDSFGTGFLSLSYLNRYPVNMFKIDRSFIHDIAKNASHAALIETIITLANKMGITVIATGIENEEQLQCLKKQCRYVQGFYFSKPLSLHKFEHFLQTAKI